MSLLKKIRYSYNWLFNPQFIAGEKAEQRFEELCRANGYIIEKIAQDRQNFAQYADNAQNNVKRGDYIIRNLRNAEIEVKCFTKRMYGSTECYAIKYSHVKRHEEMQRITQEPVIFAIFERNGRNVVEGSMRMIPLDALTKQRSRAILYDKQTKTLRVPTSIMYPNFDYFERYKAPQNEQNSQPRTSRRLDLDALDRLLADEFRY